MGFRGTSQVQILYGCNSSTTASHSGTAIPVLRMDPSPVIVNKGFRYVTKVSLARTCQRPPPSSRSDGSWHMHKPRDILTQERTAISTIRGGGAKPPSPSPNFPTLSQPEGSTPLPSRSTMLTTGYTSSTPTLTRNSQGSQPATRTYHAHRACTSSGSQLSDPL